MGRKCTVCSIKAKILHGGDTWSTRLLLEFFTCLTARGYLVIYFKLLLLWYLVLKCSRVDYPAMVVTSPDCVLFSW